MSKLTRSQKKGKASSYTSHYLKNKIKTSKYPQNAGTLKVIDFKHSPLSTVVYMKLQDQNMQTYLYPSPKNVHLGQTFDFRTSEYADVKKLSDFKIGDQVCNVEIKSQSNKFLFKTSGVCGKVVAIDPIKSTVTLAKGPKTILKSGHLLAMKGVICNNGFKLKPLVKAGTACIKKRARGKKYSEVSANAMNAQDHALGGSYKKSRGRPMTTSRHAPPKLKFGCIAARRTGKK